MQECWAFVEAAPCQQQIVNEQQEVQWYVCNRHCMQQFLACGEIGKQQYCSSSSSLQAHNQQQQMPAWIPV
jgi:hypothetical protein